MKTHPLSLCGLWAVLLCASAGCQRNFLQTRFQDASQIGMIGVEACGGAFVYVAVSGE